MPLSSRLTTSILRPSTPPAGVDLVDGKLDATLVRLEEGRKDFVAVELADLIGPVCANAGAASDMRQSAAAPASKRLRVSMHSP
jgi:hypothetical protein